MNLTELIKEWERLRDYWEEESKKDADPSYKSFAKGESIHYRDRVNEVKSVLAEDMKK